MTMPAKQTLRKRQHATEEETRKRLAVLKRIKEIRQEMVDNPAEELPAAEELDQALAEIRGRTDRFV